ncbi:efflux RND transporter permease subunit [Microbulbifer rhizosphaerae]|uniref:SSD domain-containing protein n=1 Tax=Microbulbifer rhizosphaerae TaxID=1562603 RepID=A0A7W4WD28_9GAMM|nr:MMPL family transporter [Microbulbifer rhizosphaerae]MBB3061944.1 hypothetical protein [Microbulbifer rhizosphaerae]
MRYGLLAYPGLVVSAIALLLAATAPGLGKLDFRSDYRVFFGEDNPQLREFESMQRIFAKSDNVAIIVAPGNGNVFTPGNLALLKAVSDAAWQTPYSTRVDSITNFQHTEADGDDLQVRDLLADSGLPPTTQADRIRRIALNEPLLKGRLVSPRGHVAVINITIQLPEINKSREVEEVVSSVRKLVARFENEYADVDFFLSGIVMLNNSLSEESRADIQTLIPLMLAVILLVLTLALRSTVAMLATFSVVIASWLITLGLAGYLGYFLSAATVNVPMIVMTLAVADCVHIITGVQQALARGQSRRDAIGDSLTHNLSPVLLTTATTVFGFLTFNFSDVPPFRDLGNLVALGVIIAYILSLTLLPALLCLLPLRARPSRGDNRMEHLAEWVLVHRNRLLPGILLFSLACVALLPQNRLNDVAVRYFDERVPFRQAADFMEENLSGYVFIDFQFDSGVPSGLTRSDALQQLDAFSDWLREQPEVAHVSTLSDTLKRLNMNMHGDRPVEYRLPRNSELAAQYLLLYELSLPYGLDLTNSVNIDKSATRITVTFSNIGSNQLVDFETRARRWIQDNAPDITLTAASPNLMFAHISERNMFSMVMGTLCALLLIALLLMVPLRSWRLGLAALTAMLVPAAIGFGLWAIYEGEINLGLSVVASMTIGIVVDDAVHFLVKYRRARRSGSSSEDAIRYSFSSVGPALITTTAVLASGFLVLTASSFRINANMGLLTAMIVLAALLIDLLMLPPLLTHLDKARGVIDHAAEKKIQTA